MVSCNDEKTNEDGTYSVVDKLKWDQIKIT